MVNGAKGNNGASGWEGSNGGNGGVAISGNIIVQGGATVTATGGNGGNGGSGELEGGTGGNGGGDSRDWYLFQRTVSEKKLVTFFAAYLSHLSRTLWECGFEE